MWELQASLYWSIGQCSLLINQLLHPYLHPHTDNLLWRKENLQHILSKETSRKQRERGIWSADPALFPFQPHVFHSFFGSVSFVWCVCGYSAVRVVCPGQFHHESGSDPTHYRCWSFSTKAHTISNHIICNTSTNITTTSKENQDTCSEKKQLTQLKYKRNEMKR